jgi:transcriptional regulator with XRE-family HTH domain
MAVTRGAQLLSEHLTHGSDSQQDLASILNVGQAAVSLWSRGISRPDALHREALEILIGAPLDAWWTDEEREFLKKLREKARPAITDKKRSRPLHARAVKRRAA